MKKAMIIVALIVLLFCVAGCSSKSAQQREEIWLALEFMAEDLTELSNDCYLAYESEDYEEMSYTLYKAYEKCEELKRTSEYLANKFADK